jgi:hypothetical protein
MDTEEWRQNQFVQVFQASHRVHRYTSSFNLTDELGLNDEKRFTFSTTPKKKTSQNDVVEAMCKIRGKQLTTFEKILD